MRDLARFLSLFVPPLLAFAFVACAEDASVPAAAPAPPDARLTPPPAATAPPAPDAGPPPFPWASGLVVDGRGTPIVGRPVTVIDRRGKQTSVLTDEGGTFWAADVATPYDVAIAPAPSGAVVVPLAVLGIQRRDPFFALEEEGDWAASPAQTIHVAVALPPCTGERCWVTVVTASPSGRAEATRAIAFGERTVAFDLVHTWRTDPDPARELVDVFVLTGDEDAPCFAYVRVSGVGVAPGETTDLGTIVPEPLAALGAIQVDAQTPVTPAGWDLGVGIDLVLPGGTRLPFRRAAAPVLTTVLPAIPGATFRASATATAPHGDAPFHERSSSAWSGTLPLSTPQVLLDLPSPVDVERKTPAFSRRGHGITWSRGGPGLAVVELFDLGRSRRVVRVLTEGDALSFARLDRLGLPPPELGAHLLDVTTRSSMTLDDRLRSDAPGSELAGEESHERVAVTILP